MILGRIQRHKYIDYKRVFGIEQQQWVCAGGIRTFGSSFSINISPKGTFCSCGSSKNSTQIGPKVDEKRLIYGLML